MWEETDPVELARARAQRERADRNYEWFQAHAADIYRQAQYRGKCVYVAGQELFVAATPEEAKALAQAAHPDDDGGFIHYIPRERIPRIYANRRGLVSRG